MKSPLPGADEVAAGVAAADEHGAGKADPDAPELPPEIGEGGEA